MRVAVDDVDRYVSTIAGLRLDVMRQGLGEGPNSIGSISDGRVHVNAPEVRFPTLVRGTIPDDSVVLAFMQTAPPGVRFCGVDMRPNDILFYGPGTEHTGVNQVGLRFRFLVLRRDDIHERADELGLSVADIDQASFTRLSQRPGLLVVRRMVADLFAIAAGDNPPRWLLDDLLTAVAGAMAQPPLRIIRRTDHVIDSIRIVDRCIELASRLERRPMVHELCRTAAVSERTLRHAFMAVFEVPPSVYFRIWALDQAHRRLMTASRSADTVTRVALDVGIGHLGRFSGYYRNLYGELPSETLRARHPEPVPSSLEDIG